jgi:hypothetical protein
MSGRNRTNWASVHTRNVMRRQNIESRKTAADFMVRLLPGSAPRPVAPSKADLRRQAADAVEEWQQKQKAAAANCQSENLKGRPE